MQYKLTGTVSCETSTDIEEGSTIIIMVFDGALGCGPLRIAGKKELTGITKLTFNFELEYSDEYFAERLNFGPAISCSIRKDDDYFYHTDRYTGNFYLWDKENNKLRDHVDVTLIKTPKPQE